MYDKASIIPIQPGGKKDPKQQKLGTLLGTTRTRFSPIPTLVVPHRLWRYTMKSGEMNDRLATGGGAASGCAVGWRQRWRKDECERFPIV